jgi:UTP--glucose-1-phosphate uridylyltransferase
MNAPAGVRKAVIPAAGLGTRFLPASKSQPKEMVALVDRPAIQHVVEEAAGAGIRDVLIVIGRGKSSIEDHFDRSPELEDHLEAAGKKEELAAVRAVAELARVHYVRQQEPLGLGHAVSMASEHVGSEAFAVLLPDDIIDKGADLLASMIDTHRRFGGSVLCLLEVSPEEISSYGAARVEPVEPGLVRVVEVVEKPAPERAPSNLAVVGRYLLTPSIFPAMGSVRPGKGGELQLTDGVAELMRSEPVHGRILRSGRYDVGNKLEYLKATVELALRHPELGAPFRDALSGIVGEMGIR